MAKDDLRLEITSLKHTTIEDEVLQYLLHVVASFDFIVHSLQTHISMYINTHLDTHSFFSVLMHVEMSKHNNAPDVVIFLST